MVSLAQIYDEEVFSWLLSWPNIVKTSSPDITGGFWFFAMG
jgi:hypothetical protein